MQNTNNNIPETDQHIDSGQNTTDNEVQQSEGKSAGEQPAYQYPLISCIMPTTGRAAYVAQSMQMFLAQDYPNKELIIVYNKATDLPSDWLSLSVEDFPQNVILVRALSKVLGAKRNEACRYSRGAIIAHWDDDDIYNTDRLTLQAMPILMGEADITGLQSFAFFESATGKSWMPSAKLFAEMFEGNIHGGSIMYNRYVWDSVTQFSNMSIGEDAAFLRKAMKPANGLRLKGISAPNSFVYIRHRTNAWQFADNVYETPGWQQVSLPRWAWEHAPFYQRMVHEMA